MATQTQEESKVKPMQTSSDTTKGRPPGPPAEDNYNNWLPAPKNGDFSLFMRAYWPKDDVLNGSWTPPAVVKIK
jgi:hypothetical protein